MSTNDINLNNITISIVGAGLSGSECAWQLANFGFKVKLYEMRNKILTPAHKTNFFGELVCSNSFGSYDENTAAGQLKWEAECLNSIVLAVAKNNSIPAGTSLSVDRYNFAKELTYKIKNHPNIKCINKSVSSFCELSEPIIIASGPLTDDNLSKEILKHFGENFCYFYDAISPIIEAASIDYTKVWKANRWGKGEGSYINCPLEKEEYFTFLNNLLISEKVPLRKFEKEIFFESCMPIEELARRGEKTLFFGPMRPKGLINPRTNKRPYAVVQLRAENKDESAYNMVGFQTKMTYASQKKVIRLIPGLEKINFFQFGSVHRNLYINSPKLLNKNLSSIKNKNIFYTGQIVGVEGYFESVCIGLLLAYFLKQYFLKNEKQEDIIYPNNFFALGALWNYVIDQNRIKRFQPTNINLGLLSEINKKYKNKQEKRQNQLRIAKEKFLEWHKSLN